MRNKNTFFASATAALAAASSLGLMPAASAADIYMNPNAAITKQWQKNSATYGKPLAKEVCVTGAGCAQQFENAVITWSRNTGVKVLSGAERAQAYVDAGGVKTLGALESDAWNNSFCGPSVTTFNGSNSSRWLLVVDEGKASVGSKIDLNSDAGKKWLAERAQTKQCFDAVAETPTPTQTDSVVTSAPEMIIDGVDWTHSMTNRGQQSRWLVREGKTYVIATDDETNILPSATAYEVPWMGVASNATELWQNPSPSVEFTAGSNNQFAIIGYPVADAVWDGDTAVQEFKYGTVSWTQGKEPTVRLNVEGAQRLIDLETYFPDIKLEKKDNRFYVAERQYGYENKGFSEYYVFDTQSGNMAHLSHAMYENYMASPEKFGAIDSSFTNPNNSYHSASFKLNDSQSISMVDAGTSAFYTVFYTVETTTTAADGTQHTETSGKHMASTWVPQDPATVDWSQAYYEPRQGALVYTDELSVLIVKANADGTAPAEGAPVYRSHLLGAQKSLQTIGTWTQYAEWANGYWGGEATDATALGLPIADPVLTNKDGVSYETQQFEGGTITWRMLSEDYANVDQATITLNEIGQARLGQ